MERKGNTDLINAEVKDLTENKTGNRLQVIKNKVNY